MNENIFRMRPPDWSLRAAEYVDGPGVQESSPGGGLDEFVEPRGGSCALFSDGTERIEYWEGWLWTVAETAGAVTVAATVVVTAVAATTAAISVGTTIITAVLGGSPRSTAPAGRGAVGGGRS
jgi:hypothetical protein